MLSRILPILALIVLCVLGWFLYSQEIIQKIIRPTVVVVETKRQLIEGQQVRRSFIEVRDISINRVSPGMVTFPSGTTAKDVEKTLAGQTLSRNIPAGQYLLSTMMGERARVYVLKTTQDIKAGDSLSTQNIQTSELRGAPLGGVVIFETEEEGALFLNQAYDLTATRDIPSNQFLTISDTSSKSEQVFVIQAARSFGRSERLSIDGLEAAEISNRDMPSGAITFQTRGATDVFITAANRYALSDALEAGDILTADLISGEGLGLGNRDPDDLPETLSELTAYIQAYPDRAMFVDSTTLIGHEVDAGDRVDIWTEYDRTSGEFGEIRIRRLVSGALVREAIDDTRKIKKTPEGAGDGAESTEEESRTEEDDESRKRFLWIATDPDEKHRYEAARLGGEGVAFMIRDDARLVDVLGNGAACLEGRCQVNRNASEDLERIVSQLRAADAPSGQATIVEMDPLTVMDGVSPELEESLRANGYDSFEVIAGWKDSDMPAITIKLDISNNLAVYIRQQARILSGSADEAAKSLGFKEVPRE